jgi:hypothetical protein
MSEAARSTCKNRLGLRLMETNIDFCRRIELFRELFGIGDHSQMKNAAMNIAALAFEAK